MKQYLDLLKHVLENGLERPDRTGTGCLSVFGYQTRYSLKDGFPLVTTKRVHLKSVIYELLWFLRGDTNVKYLNDNGVSIWDAWADDHGDFGGIYGAQWRRWEMFDCPGVSSDFFMMEIDQIDQVIKSIITDPFGRRHIVSAWNVADIPGMALPPCHILFQFYVMEKEGERFLDCQLYQRSADLFLGVPFNIASYSLLTMMIAQVCGLKSGEFIHTIGDAHIYLNHVDQVKEQLSREPRPLPKMKINPFVDDIDGFRYEDFMIEGYDPHPAIKGEVAV